MGLESFITLTNEPVSSAELESFERDYQLTIPNQYKDLLKLSNGVEVTGSFQHPLHDDPEWRVTLYPRLASIDELRSGFIMFKDINHTGVLYQFQDKILMIGGTQDGAHIMLGHSEPITGQLFIDDESETTSEGEIALFLVAPSLIDFLTELEPI